MHIAMLPAMAGRVRLSGLFSRQRRHLHQTVCVVSILCVAGLGGGCSSMRSADHAAAAAAPCGGSEWHFVFANDGQGRELKGSRSTLLTAIRRGSPVRVGWSEASAKEKWSVEEFSDTGFTNIMGDREVVAQLSPAMIQSHYLDASRAGLRNPAVEWQAIMSTNGRFEALMIERASGRTIRKLVQRTRINWYVYAPPPGCDRREAILHDADQQNEIIEDKRFDGPAPVK